jgi:hypothetical protein
VNSYYPATQAATESPLRPETPGLDRAVPLPFSAQAVSDHTPARIKLEHHPESKVTTTETSGNTRIAGTTGGIS